MSKKKSKIPEKKNLNFETKFQILRKMSEL